MISFLADEIGNFQRQLARDANMIDGNETIPHLYATCQNRVRGNGPYYHAQFPGGACTSKGMMRLYLAVFTVEGSAVDASWTSSVNRFSNERSFENSVSPGIPSLDKGVKVVDAVVC
jgi:hypothetical protein